MGCKRCDRLVSCWKLFVRRGTIGRGGVPGVVVEESVATDRSACAQMTGVEASHNPVTTKIILQHVFIRQALIR
jgi:hypothetical protein